MSRLALLPLVVALIAAPAAAQEGAGASNALGQESAVPAAPVLPAAPPPAGPAAPEVVPLTAPERPEPLPVTAGFAIAPGSAALPVPLPQHDGALLSLPFAAQGESLPSWSAAALPLLSQALAERPSARLELRAYAAAEGPADREGRHRALARALAVRAFLVAHGIAPQRIDIRALGAQAPGEPLDRVDLEPMD